MKLGFTTERSQNKNYQFILQKQEELQQIQNYLQKKEKKWMGPWSR